MKKMRVYIVTLGLAFTAGAGDLTIQSFNGTGRLTFSEIPTATVYRVEWASAPNGAWHTGEPGATGIVARGSGQHVVTVGVSATSCFYRVVASVTNAAPPSSGDYLVIDLSGGTNAATYPVSYLMSVPGGGWSDVYKTTKLVLRKIAPGMFTMGSPADELGRKDDETQYAVTLTKGFYIGVFEVTQRQWELVMGNRPSYFTNAAYYAARPVERVSYCDIRENPANSAISPDWPQSSQVHADSFMGRLRAKTGLSAFDLPTESQWEYACRAGTAKALNSGYNITNANSDANLAAVGRYYFNGPNTYGYSTSVSTNGGTAAAGSKLPNAWGLYDMHGNVLEWCLDWYGIYPGAESDPAGAASGSYRVFRGGSWNNSANYCRSANRINFFSPYYRNFSVGFRVVRILP